MTGSTRKTKWIAASLAILLSQCIQASPSKGGGEQLDSVLIHSSTDSLAGLSPGMDVSEVIALGYPTARRIVEEEGDEYEVLEVSISDAVRIDCHLTKDRKVHNLSTVSRELRDEHGLGVGSSVRELKAAYPNGHLFVTDESGIHAKFITGGHLLFTFDPADISAKCLESSGLECDEDKIVVIEVEVFGFVIE